MFAKVTRSWTLFKASWEVLRADKELAVFPVLSSLACLALLAAIFVPAGFSGLFDGFADEDRGPPALFYGLLFAFYFGSFFVVTFFNTALVACAVKRLEGGEPTVSYGLGEAGSRLGIILGWTLLASTVGMILHAIEERAGLLGSIVSRLLGTLWALATFFVVPILVVERKGPLAALRESASLLKRTWGEQITSGVGFGLVGMLLGIPGVFLVAAGIAAGAAGAGAFMAVSIGALGVAWILGLAIVSATLQTIFQAALYLYARDGRARGAFSEESLRGAVVPRK